VSDVEDFLAHYGVKGMRWGKRKNPNYSDQQVKRDVQVYGKRGAKRINNSLNDGNSISVARGDEKTRRDGVMSKNKYVRQGGKAAGAVAGAGIGFLAVKGLGMLAESEFARKTVEKAMMGVGGKSFMQATRMYHVIREPISTYTSTPAVQAVVAAGAAKVGHMLAGDIAVNTRMRMHGYDPNRK
jgi:hypothetical protein